DFVPNYDETRTEPTVFPAAFPTLLDNGGTGIAVGMATNIPPHNLVEVIDGICAQIDDPDITLEGLMKHVKGPDFPTGCAICGVSGVKQYLATGRGSMKVRGKAGVEEIKGGKGQIVITEIPFNENRATQDERIAEFVNEKVLSEITACREQSDENTVGAVVVKPAADSKLLAFEFTKKQVEQIGILIRNAARLTEGRYAFSEHQANQILDLRLYQLTGLERDKIDKEYKELIKTIQDLRDILAKEQRVFTIVKKELRELRDKHGSPRLTQFAVDEGEINMEDLIANEGCIISITHGGFIKRTAVSAFRAQRRGGKGVIGMATREGATEQEEGDFVEHLFTATTHDYLMFFTATGRAYVEKVYEIPEMGRAAKGRSIANILELKPDEKIAATIRVQSKKSGTGPNAIDQTWDENLHIVFATESGIVKKSNLSDYANVRRGGIIAIQIEEGDRLIDAKLTNGNNEIVLITKDGMSLRFHEEQLRDQGRNTVG